MSDHTMGIGAVLLIWGAISVFVGIAFGKWLKARGWGS